MRELENTFFIWGLFLFESWIDKFSLRENIGKFLPKKLRNRGMGSWEKFKTGILGFIAGGECLDDLDVLCSDPLFDQLTGGGMCPVTMGRFLRSFERRSIESLKDGLASTAWRQRLWKDPNCHKIVFTMDATSHQQYGLRMEGVDFNYKNIRALESQNLFDDYGLCYGFDLRKGGTHSAVGAVEMMERALRVIPKGIKLFFRADSAYANLDMYRMLLTKNCQFTIALGERSYRPLLEKFGNKIRWHKKEMRFFDQKSCEMGSLIYPLKGLPGRSFLRVVIVRGKKSLIKAGDNHPYNYFAIVTDMSESEMSEERVVRFYRKRSNVENAIKDLKNGMDFHHFPCQSLLANHAWGLMGIFAYNLMRLASFQISGAGCFVRTTRRKLVCIACELVRHARTLELRMRDFLAKEVNRIGELMVRADASRAIGRSIGPPMSS